jgi:DNA-binding GntR family transcriptional regulator
MKLKRVPVLSRMDAVAEALRVSILSGELEAGQRLNLDAIAEQLGVSRMPVREAVKQLEGEGLVTIYPHRGIEVSRLKLADIEEIFDLRVLLEGHAVARAVPRLTAENLAVMEVALHWMDRADISPRVWMDQNRIFHDVVNLACGSPRLIALIASLRDNVERYIRAYLTVRGREHPQRQHHEMFNACRDGDVARAVEVISAHVGDTAHMLITALHEEGDGVAARGNGQTARRSKP